MPSSERLDIALVRRGLVESRNKAQRLIMAGQVRVNSQTAVKPSHSVHEGDRLVVDDGPRFVSRGGQKLEAALQAFEISVSGAICADIGASTGGFTDCLLQHGAKVVYAIDVGRGQLHWSLRRHEKVVVMERTNARYLESLPEPIEVLTVDVSFISLRLLLAPALGLLTPNGQAVVLIKPQFEAGREAVGPGGVVRDPNVRRAAANRVLMEAASVGWKPLGLIRSPITGSKGNVEFLAWLSLNRPPVDLDRLLGAVFEK